MFYEDKTERYKHNEREENYQEKAPSHQDSIALGRDQDQDLGWDDGEE